MYKAVEVRLPQIDTELSNLKIKIKVQKTIIDKLKEQMKGLDKQQSKLIAGGYSAAAGFGAGQAQIAAGKTQIEHAQKELDDAEDKLEEFQKGCPERTQILMHC